MKERLSMQADRRRDQVARRDRHGGTFFFFRRHRGASTLCILELIIIIIVDWQRLVGQAKFGMLRLVELQRRALVKSLTTELAGVLPVHSVRADVRLEIVAAAEKLFTYWTGIRLVIGVCSLVFCAV